MLANGNNRQDDNLNKRTSDNLDLGNAVAVTEDNTNLRRGSTLSGELADLVDDLLGGGLQPGRSRTAVGNSRGANTLSLAVHTTVASWLVQVFGISDYDDASRVISNCEER